MNTYRVTVSAAMPVHKVVTVQANDEEEACTKAGAKANRSASGWKRKEGYVIDIISGHTVLQQVCNVHDILMDDGICEECLKADDARLAKAERLAAVGRH